MKAPEHIKSRLAQIRAEIVGSHPDYRAWARRLRMRELACERLTQFQRAAWREAIASC